MIDSTAATKYTASKELTFDGKVFACNSATVKSRTEITITDIRSSLPELRGRLVKRIATTRARETQAEAIVGGQTESKLCQKIDADFENRLADMNRQFEKKLSILRRFPEADKQLRLRLRSASDGVEVGLGRPSLNTSDREEKRKPIGESVELWLRRSENLVAEGPITAMLLTKAPLWLSSYFLEAPVSKPDRHRCEVELHENWIVVRLHE